MSSPLGPPEGTVPEGRSLVFLHGPEGGGVLLHEGRPVEPGCRLAVERKRSPWREGGQTVRVIVGSHPARADILLAGEGIHPEHVRLYGPSAGEGPLDLLVIHPGSTRVNGARVEPREWTSVEGGEELALGPWLFRYEVAP